MKVNAIIKLDILIISDNHIYDLINCITVPLKYINLINKCLLLSHELSFVMINRLLFFKQLGFFLLNTHPSCDFLRKNKEFCESEIHMYIAISSFIRNLCEL